MSSKEFRFCVGSPSTERSSVWKIWVNKNDIYIQTRMMGSDSKVSLHESGQFQWSMTTEWMAKQTNRDLKNVDRHIVRWKRPEILDGAAKLVFEIIIPKSELREENIKESYKKVYWYPAPAPGFAVQLECYITPPLSDAPDISNSPYEHLVSMSLDDGKWFVVFVHTPIVTEGNKTLLEVTRAQIAIMADENGVYLQPQYRACAFIDKGDSKGLIEIVPYKSK